MADIEKQELAEEIEASVPEEPVKKRRGGRVPYTPEQKEAARKRREEEKKMADNLSPEIYVQFQEAEANISDLVERAKSAFKQEHKRTRILSMKLYVKPEERAAYYVINEGTSGKVEY